MREADKPREIPIDPQAFKDTLYGDWSRRRKVSAQANAESLNRTCVALAHCDILRMDVSYLYLTYL